MSVKIGRHGAPAEITMPMKNLDNKNEKTSKVRDTRWKDAEKPYLDIQSKTAVSSGEAHLLYDMAKRLGSGNYANLGVAAGKSVGCLAWGLKYSKHKGKVYAVDYFGWAQERFQPEGLRKTLKDVIEYVEFCKGYTHEWAPRLAHLKFRGMFIDADHNYETCKADWELWNPMIEVGGEVAFHDTHKNTVDKVVREHIDYTCWKQVDHIYSIKLFKRLK